MHCNKQNILDESVQKSIINSEKSFEEDLICKQCKETFKPKELEEHGKNCKVFVKSFQKRYGVFECKKCPFKHTEILTMNRHLNEEHKKSQNPLKKEKNNQEKISNSPLKVEINKMDLGLNQKQEKKLSKARNIACLHCQEEIEEEDKKFHIKQCFRALNHIKGLRCMECGVKFNVKFEIFRHVKLEHLD